ncbi:MAG: diaminopimelate decarboxylase [Alphaproteobacteria bacterium GM202ARS2]|nr:diaminopimelate decarboxylase [Alphaproteobacteria bacterium GM202ARS2]
MTDTFFRYKQGQLYCEDVALAVLLRGVATPFYVYSRGRVQTQARLFRQTVAELKQETLVCYAVKANGLTSLLRILADEGLGADIVSQGELVRALRGGVKPDTIVFSGVGKSRDELKLAMNTGIKQINIESEAELQDIIEVAEEGGLRDVPCALRVNTDTPAPTHRTIATAHKDDKFGIAIEAIPSLATRIANHRQLRLCGLATHIGSNMTELVAFKDAFIKLRELAWHLAGQGLTLETLDLGGGLASRSDDEDKALVTAYRDMIAEVFADYGGTLIFEPGRFLMAKSGVLVSRVLRSKKADKVTYLLIDAGMNDMMRTALYDGCHPIKAVRQGEGQTYLYHVAGPICESTDVFQRDASLPRLERGDAVVLSDVGAYGSVLAHQYNARPLIAELLVDKGQHRVIKRSFSVDDALALEDDE